MNTPLPHPRPPASGRPAIRDMLAEIDPLIACVPAYGPPVLFLLGPWLFLVLMLAAPFALVVVMILAATVLAAVTATLVAVLAAPYLLVRHLRRHRAGHASISAPAVQAVAVESPRVAA